ncbi:bifunctional methylenetetrahydrofolate dehydrogenase/methenyltetrahydrofolate cyclohydrolase FolD [Candidatus Endowatersipora endosymbiont of Watersipora subatra]|uniref:bifunctional methylenetetrahydrofolate dehydrogenase/methenyltetrahydrofolate cyclohydrolase FolD n=1 Tax=Candidatus Endowatersipora endosymbiont of Watersipora subatra TaxID=3077946 RepID=UPI00312CA830
MITKKKRIDGQVIARDVISSIQSETKKLIQETHVTPGLAVILVGENPASLIYVASKSQKANDCGFHSIQRTLPADSTEEEVLNHIRKLNDDQTIHGILVQLPLPDHINEKTVIQTVAAEKDVDGFHPLNVGKLGRGDLSSTFIPCTPAGVMLLIRRFLGDDLSGLNAIVIGRSNIVGKPMAHLLLNANCTVTIAHSQTNNLSKLTRITDIVVVAVGQPQMVKRDWIKPGAMVIDVGINRIVTSEHGERKFRLIGDVDYEGALVNAAYVTPVPGGVGPMTVALLMANTLASACRFAGYKIPKF